MNHLQVAQKQKKKRKDMPVQKLFFSSFQRFKNNSIAKRKPETRLVKM
jgi:hypothetical protein